MKRNQAGLTAVGIAFARAVESKKPAGERICYDPFARQFVPGAWYALMKFFDAIGYSEKRGPGVLGFLTARGFENIVNVTGHDLHAKYFTVR
jgi:O-methyltransferase involved in polyketide biosynthesis